MKTDKKIVNAWCMYDWANSAYALVIISTIFPIYYGSVTIAENGSDIVNFWGINISNSVLFTFSISFSYLVTAILSPLLSGIADYNGTKKTFMKIFCYLGAFSCMSLFFFTKDTLNFAIPAFVLSNIGFSGSIVFYNSYLPEIADKDEIDQISAKGFSMGYIGSVILLVLNLLLFTNKEILSPFTDAPGALAARISFLSVGIWWLGFAQITFRKLPLSIAKPNLGHPFLSGIHEILKVAKEIKHLYFLKTFLLAFFLYSMGVQTVMYVATLFGEKELKIPSAQLQGIILLLQLIAIPGANLFAKVSHKIGNFKALSIIISVWIGICIGAYFVSSGIQFWVLAGVVGFVMGGVQSLSRSTYAKYIPENQDDTTSYFSFYDVMEKMSIVLGTISYGIIDHLTGSMRNSTLVLGGYFILGLSVLLLLVRKQSK